MLGKSITALLTSAVAFSFGISAPAEAAFIDTTGTDAGTIFNFGDPDTGTYGQTFTVTGSDTLLDGFSLYLRDRGDLGAGPLDLRGYIASWNGVMATTILFESSTQTMNAAGTLQEFSFSTNLSLVSGNTYVAFLSISNLPDTPDDQFGMPFGSDSIPGEFVFLNNGHDFGALTTSLWNLNWVGDNDAWFKASLIPERVAQIPEPATAALFGAGLAGLAWISRRRKAS